jgi:tetratricopeptide (TPR) repeat protein
MQRALLAGVVGILMISAAQAQTRKDDRKEWLESPYQLTVQLHVQEHPLMTPVFVKSIERELSDTLQSDLGQMCQVTVTMHKSQTMEDILAKGWGELDKGHPINDKKTHYVRVLYLDGGQYEIQSRQVDGYTGYVSPLRKARTSDRLWVARKAALMIAQDFGVVGQVVDTVKEVYRVKLKGANLAEPDSVRVQAGDVLAITQMRSFSGGKITSDRVQDALLYVTGVDKDGATTRLFNRWELRPKDRATIGYRVIKLGTCWAPLKLRIVDRKTREPIPGIPVSVRPGGLESIREIDLGATDPQGRVTSKEMIFRNVAFVQITASGRKSGIPLPLLHDDYVDFALSGTQEDDRRVEFEVYNRQWQSRVNEVFLFIQAEEARIRDLILKGKEAEALQVARDLLARMNEDLLAVREGLNKVKDAASRAGPETEAQIKKAPAYIDALAKRIAHHDEQIKDWENPSPASLKIKEGQTHVEAADYERAIAAFREALQRDPSRTRIKTLLEDMEKVWNIKAPDLAKARQFIFEAWPTLEPADMDKYLGELEDALKAIEKHGDNLTAHKLFKANFDHRAKLNASRDALNPDTNEDDRDKAATIDRLVEAINKYNARALEVMERGAKE